MKAARVQAMRERRPINAPVTAPVTYEMLMLLIKGAPDILKPYLASKWDEIKRHSL